MGRQVADRRTPIRTGADSGLAGRSPAQKTKPRLTAYEQIRDRLREDIVSGGFPPGSRLTVATIAKRYGVGAMPIRIALQELRGQGLLTGEPRRGAQVREVDAELISNVYDIRLAILGILFPRCIRYITNADIEEIEAIQAKLDEALKRRDIEAVRKGNIAFHKAIYRIARNPEALAVLEQNWGLIDALRAKFGFGEGRAENANRIHRQIIQALKKRDAAEALALARTSAERSRQDLIALVTQGAAG